jgi:hypothetical protein
VKGNYNRQGASPKAGDGLTTKVMKVEKTEGVRLNPRWVEVLMGLPIGHTMPSCGTTVVNFMSPPTT